MDRTEAIAEAHLRVRGFDDIRYEPDGNVPPDFLLDERIAVEVRRLNQNDFNVDPPRGHEEVDVPVVERVRKLLRSYGMSDTVRYIGLDFTRPVPEWRRIEPGARAFLEAALRGEVPDGISSEVASNIELKVIGTGSEDGGEAFHLGFIHSSDWGGWVHQELEQNARLCIAEKTQKVMPYRDRYPEWWLVLIDHVAYALSDSDRDAFRQQAAIDHNWDKVVIVSPIDVQQYFEL